MKKRILSAFLIAATVLSATGCMGIRDFALIPTTNIAYDDTTTYAAPAAPATTTAPAETTTPTETTAPVVTAPPVVTTKPTATTTASQTTEPKESAEEDDFSVNAFLGKTYYNLYAPPYDEYQKYYIRCYFDSIGQSYPTEVLDEPAETTKPTATTSKPTTTTSKPTETTKPVDKDDEDVKLGSFTGEPEINWDGKELELEIKCVPGATEYHLSVDSKGFTDNGDLTNEKKLSKNGRSTIDLASEYDRSLPRYVYVRITATNGKESVKTDIKYDTYRGSVYGDAGHIDGRTVVVSVFVDDPTTKWTNSAADKQTMDESWESMRCATEWLTRSAAKYGANAEFIWDWKKDSDLKYMTRVSTELDADELDTGHVFAEGEEWKRDVAYQMVDIELKQKISDIEYDWFQDQTDLLEKYDADNIIYFYIVNTDSNNKANSFALSEQAFNSTEYIVVYVKEQNYTARANTYAHEMLHLFGAPDLYCENKTITKAYVDHLHNNGCNNIMYYGQSKDNITREFTDLEAYYTGLLSYCADVEKWGLGDSDFFRGW